MAALVYRVILLMSVVLSSSYFAAGIYAGITCSGCYRAVQIDTAWMMVTLATVQALPVWRKEMSDKGATASMVHWATEHGFCWKHTLRSAHVAWLGIFCVIVAYVVAAAQRWRLGASVVQIITEARFDEKATSHGKVQAIIEFTSLPFRCLWVAVLFGQLWMINFISQLHRHDLLNYAHAMTEALEVEDPNFNPMPHLKELETLVTTRLRHASSTWVKVAVELLFICVLAFLLLVPALLNGDFSELLHMLSHGVNMLVAVAGAVFIGWPLASVAETFEYDVVRYLNNPVVLSRAIKHLGNQTLSHLQFLEWGFRYSGCVINSRYVLTIMFGLLATLVGSVGQAMFKFSI